jgi:predicted nucleotidyltransferase
MAQGNFREYLRGEIVWRKKYLYVLRPLLAMRWIDTGRSAVPMEFGRLVAETITDPLLRRAVDDLVAAKRAGAELDEGPRIPVISEFIEGELSRLDGSKIDEAGDSLPVGELDAILRLTLAQLWPDRQPA